MAEKTTFDVGVDLDGVVYDFVSAFVEEARLQGAGNIPKKAVARGWQFYRAWGITDEEFLTIYTRGVHSGRILWDGGLYPGTTEGWKALRDAGHRIHVLTDRRPPGAEDAAYAATCHWLTVNGLRPDSLTITADKTEILNLAVDPSKVAFIEDKPENHAALTQAGVHAVLMHRSWNENAPGQRVPNLLTFAQIVNSLPLR